MRNYKEILFCKLCRKRFIFDPTGPRNGYCPECQKNYFAKVKK